MEVNLMKKTSEILNKLQFYPCQRTYTGCQGKLNTIIGDCGPGSGRDLKTEGNRFALGDCGELSFD